MPYDTKLWNLSSRVHQLNRFPNEGVACYVKRDDELGSGISGTKLRKYASLLPCLIERRVQHLIIIAGPQSNNLLAALQLARESNLQVTAFLIKPWKLDIQGNFKLSSLFLEEKEIIWVEREQWQHVNDTANQYLSSLNETGFVLNEGASVPEALPGAMTLATDVVQNEKDLNIVFDHLFIDAGTGFSAAALIKGLRDHQKIKIHVLLLADDEETFLTKLEQWVGFVSQNYDCFYPVTAKSFGSTNQTIKKEIRRLAREEGILADPIYSAKLFYESRRYIIENQLQGNVLIIHSGGTLTMAGFDYPNSV